MNHPRPARWLRPGGAPRAAALALLLAACSAPAGAREERVPERFPNAANRCVPRQTISSWRPIDAYRMRLFADREYIVEMLTRCGTLTSTEGLVFRSNDSQICDYRSDQVQTDSETCPIGSIRTVEEVEREQAPKP